MGNNSEWYMFSNLIVRECIISFYISCSLSLYDWILYFILKISLGMCWGDKIFTKPQGNIGCVTKLKTKGLYSF